ncbi:signal transduction histidine kinase [Streptacidiphilus sp. MAP12-20]|uniref:ATP-binding protein n=1 Tax=Streptacidiphilus sp. MAP12-20 TaxID=3156299 RepID=UPI00351375CC
MLTAPPFFAPGARLMDHRLRFAPEILARLGEELVPHPDLGIMELVRNAYDADATLCRIKLSGARKVGGTLTVSDDGDGMTEAELASGFLLIGRSGKSSATHSRLKRRKVGEKGLGRLAALRLGTKVTVTTRSREEPGIEHVLSIDWNRIDASQAVDDVPLRIVTRAFDATTSDGPAEWEQGTTVTVTGLRQSISAEAGERLARSLLLLSGPFADSTAFTVECDTPEYTGLSKLVNSKLLRHHEYRLVAVLDGEGQASATLYNWRGEAEFTGGHVEVGHRRGTRRKKDGDPPLAFVAPEATFELWMFNLNPSAAKKELRLAEQPTQAIRKWLRHVGGIHLYHRELRVQPYGDQGNDWLDINLRRTGSPEKRPSTATSLGRLLVEDPEDVLRPKTDRSGFVETFEFSQLQEFAKSAMDWAADQRLEQREQGRVGASVKAHDQAEEADIQFRRILAAIAPPDAGMLPFDAPSDPATLQSLADSATKVVSIQKQEIEALRDDLLLYRSLATVGTSTAVFAHEALRPAARIANSVKTLRRRIKSLVSPEGYKRDFEDAIETSIDSAVTLETFSQLPLSLLEKNKREVGDIDFDATCRSVVRLFKRYLDERSIQVDFDLDAEGATVHTTIADIESILSNLLANAAHAFTRTDVPMGSERTIRIRTRLVERDDALGQDIALVVDDSGPGIVGISLKSIWLPGKTTFDNGTGLGLTIVRDIVGDLRGTQEARAQGELGGARMLVQLPARTLGGDGSGGPGEGDW